MLLYICTGMSVYVPTSHANAQQHSQAQIECLAKNVYHESRGGGDKGMIAVAHVTMNRVKSPLFPKSICGVVHQSNQFSWVRNNPKIREKGMYAKSKEIALGVLSGKYGDVSKGATYFHAVSVKPSWARNMIVTLKTGGHVFYKK